ncbi:RNA ligase RtcB family protein [Microvirga solisilvae]|uniref:RNA ligase RtcB family protein n=1 Tax=Microvirga solisilvae TaxID=2919498 RepID=UPI001FAFDB96|nr:RNA ligase RtcB family protein [Microvirga solisilvae]
MGNPISADANRRVRLFTSPQSWIEGAAIRQLEQLAERNGVETVAGMPDLHPGMNGPVGCAALSRNIVHPDVVGTDIGCGMQFWSLDLKEHRLKLDKAADRMLALEGPWGGDAKNRFAEHGLDAGLFTESLGTIGGGNHFCEVQAVAEILDEESSARAGIAKGGLYLLVHSGSRGLGAHTLSRHHPGHAHGIALNEGGLAYLEEHDIALRFAALNRRVIAQRAIEALRTEGVEIVDAPHNFAERQGDTILHRKGAASSNRPLLPIPGSRGAVTYLVEPLAEKAEEALFSLAHGAGRKHDRASMEKRVRTQAGDLDKLTRNTFGGRIICMDRKLLVEEAPEAYKDIRRVVADLEAHGLCRTVAIMRPLITFKTARDASRSTERRRS